MGEQNWSSGRVRESADGLRRRGESVQPEAAESSEKAQGEAASPVERTPEDEKERS